MMKGLGNTDLQLSFRDMKYWNNCQYGLLLYDDDDTETMECQIPYAL